MIKRNIKKVMFFILILAISFGCTNQGEAEDTDKEKGRYEIMREKMVEEQIKKRGVKDPVVLKAMGDVPRHEFVPDERKDHAYYDGPLPIGHQQTISQPYIVALMTELLEVKEDHKVLEIGTGSGYQAAVLAEICEKVYTIELLEPLHKRSNATLERLGYDHVETRLGDGYKGWPEEAPFDRIIVTAAAPEVPVKLFEQLKEGGIMVIPLGKFFQDLYVITKKNGEMKEKSVIPVRFVPLVKGNE